MGIILVNSNNMSLRRLIRHNEEFTLSLFIPVMLDSNLGRALLFLIRRIAFTEKL